MSKTAQRVVVIQDASRDVCSSAVRWALDGLSLQPGDEITLLGVLHQVNNPSTFPSIGGVALSKVGYKSKLDATNPKIIDEEVMRKEKEYENSIEILQLITLCDIRKVIFHKRVVPADTASSPKVTAVEAAKDLQATWIILDRQMKKDKKYFLERLSCGISRMKRNNNIERLRGPKEKVYYGNVVTHGRQSRALYEMLPGPEREQEMEERMKDTPEEDDLFSLDISPIRSENFHEKSSVETRINRGESPHVSGEWLWQLSANRLTSSGGKDPEVSSFHEQEDNVTVIQTSKARDCMPCVIFEAQVIEKTKAVENIELGNANIDEEASTSSFVMAQLEEPVENSVCSYCKEGKASAGWKDFTYTELKSATKDFSKENFLSEGGFGSVYQGKLEDGQWVAVKQHKHASLQGEKEFISEVYVLSKARHKNVVTLLGSCSEGSQRLLVYEFICNGSLDKHLSGCSSKALSWRERIKIALGAARGLNYLHQNNIIHRDMRPDNILITHSYEALIGDFGLAKTKHDAPDNSENNILGAVGYLAPEYAESGNATTETDVYSFGVLLLELITGQNVNKTLRGRGLLEWAIPLLNERRYPELIDEKIQDSYDVLQLFWMFSVADRCLSKDPNRRPTMKQVKKALQCIMDNKTVGGLNDFLTSAPISTPRSNDSSVEQETNVHDILISNNSSNKEITQMNEAFLTASSAETSLGRLLSSSVSTDNTTLQGGANCRKGKSKPRRVSYDEMLS